MTLLFLFICHNQARISQKPSGSSVTGSNLPSFGLVACGEVAAGAEGEQGGQATGAKGFGYDVGWKLLILSWFSALRKCPTNTCVEHATQVFLISMQGEQTCGTISDILSWIVILCSELSKCSGDTYFHLGWGSRMPAAALRAKPGNPRLIAT